MPRPLLLLEKMNRVSTGCFLVLVLLWVVFIVIVMPPTRTWQRFGSEGYDIAPALTWVVGVVVLYILKMAFEKLWHRLGDNNKRDPE